MPGVPVARLPDGEMQSQVADEVARGREAPDVADGGLQRRCGGDVDAGDRHQPAHVGVVDDAAGDLAVEPSELAVEEVQLAQRAVERQLLVIGHADRREPRPALGAEQIGDLRTLD
jgi:hypothetical protein